MGKYFYLTTTLPYVNAEPHIGFALEIVHADILARYHVLLGDEVFFNTGTDEHGIKIYRKAQEEGKDPQAYTDKYAGKFRSLKEKLNLYPDLHFIRTTDPHHKSAAQEFWRRCKASGDIERKLYKTKYCIGCELEKTDSELVDGKCPIHPNLEVEVREEENYFFRFSKYQKPLLDMYMRRPDFVVPDFRFNEIKKFVEAGLEDFSISRLKSKMPWGVPVPDDPEHVMYVWFDALINYTSTLGWPSSAKASEGKPDDLFTKFWGTKEHPNAIQMAGKDQIRQQAAMWQAMLMSAELPPTKQIVIHGFITVGGEKMSKSLGNVIDPIAIVDEYGADALRYYLARHVHPFEDSDFTMGKFKEAYNADLANGVGNVVARVMQLSEANGVVTVITDRRLPASFTDFLNRYDMGEACGFVQDSVRRLDQKINEEESFKVIKKDVDIGKVMIQFYVQEIRRIAQMLAPIMPAASKSILNAVKQNKKPENLFPRKE
ncbi:methionine--tRNA ligase [Candidatus Kaiserbacteria bacterium RIFCSPLOWO2_01_FULL_54_13]|uniref:Methionine--tRNA ligase n=1 Tax=Candidatus Kaiserbacteria bacterium RIFCSPLOWO2_01_FULL_54_13 TaxID=1798512 RepID=A0A1F6F0H0_9BACT|nr:MAG: methionine--tRNA ligase [Candidatus Kaiserbacteria bacterium RIFCSPLOWO2_01_FULL_54_13]